MRSLVRWLALRVGLAIVIDAPPEDTWIAVAAFPIRVGGETVMCDGLRVRR